MVYFLRMLLVLSVGVLGVIASVAQTPAPPVGVQATGYEAHIEIQWIPGAEPGIGGYQIFRSTDGGQTYTLFSVTSATANRVLDWMGPVGPGVGRHYRLKTIKTNGQTSDFSDVAAAQTVAMSDEELLDMVQQYTFRYFWDNAHPVSGMALERSNGNANLVTTGGSGFGIMAILVAAERGWVTRAEALDRMVKIASFLQFADRFHGVFPHWMNGTNGNVIPFSTFDDGADLVETAFLMQGLLAARQYFDGNTPLESALRSIITGLWEEVEWDWFRKDGGPALYWHWSPNHGWKMNFPLRGFFEAQIVYLLAAASPTHPVPGSLYQSGWTANANYCTTSSFYGYRYYCGGYAGGPLFFAHYSYLGFDPRNWKDACCNYFIRNRNHALIQWEYAKSNPKNHIGYGSDCWGLTSCDGPNGYSAHDIFPANDNGTVAPTAALASFPYTPDQSMAALKNFYRNLGGSLWGLYGFYDAFNLNQNWFAPSYLAIDQGPIVGMIENYRTGLLWNLFMKNPEIEPALAACGFVPDNAVGTSGGPAPAPQVRAYPNPVCGDFLQLSLQVEQAESLSADLIAPGGQYRYPLFSNRLVLPGNEPEVIPVHSLPPGIYFLRVYTPKEPLAVLKLVRIR